MTPDYSKQRSVWPWVWGFLLIFLAHAAAVFWLNERYRPSAPPARPQPLIYMAGDPDGERRVSDLVGTDPTLFALASQLGFSGEAWLSFAPPELATSNWSAPPSWLPLSTGQLGTAFLAIAATNRVPVDALLDGLRAATPFELRISPGLLQPESELTLDRRLSSRGLLHKNDLPVATNSEILSNTVMEVTVNGNGAVESVLLLATSGLASLDEAAVQFAQGLRFEPLQLAPRSRQVAVPDRGKATITWRVVPPPVTNGLTAASP